jgi:hypothetical protein
LEELDAFILKVEYPDDGGSRFLQDIAVYWVHISAWR